MKTPSAADKAFPNIYTYLNWSDVTPKPACTGIERN